MNHSQWKTRRTRALLGEQVEPSAAYIESQFAVVFAKVVYDRRMELGLTQGQLAERAGLTQAKISRIEGADTVPTLPLLRRLAKALDGFLTIDMDGETEEVRFTARKIA